MHLMHNIFREQLDDFIVIFLDDILVYSKDLEAHVTHVRKTLEISAAKSVVCQSLQMCILSIISGVFGSHCQCRRTRSGSCQGKGSA